MSKNSKYSHLKTVYSKSKKNVSPLYPWPIRSCTRLIREARIWMAPLRWKDGTERTFHRHGIGRSPRELRALVQRFSAPQSASVRSVGVTRSWTVRGHRAPLIRLPCLDACLSRPHRWVYIVTRVHTHHLILAANSIDRCRNPGSPFHSAFINFPWKIIFGASVLDFTRIFSGFATRARRFSDQRNGFSNEEDIFYRIFP